MPKLEPMQQPPSAVPADAAARAARVSTSLAEINVVPLVDVMLVLLVIFMVAAPMMQQGFHVQLPQSRQSTRRSSAPVTVTVPVTFRRDQRVQIDGEFVSLEVLDERVRQALEGNSQERRDARRRRRHHDAGSVSRSGDELKAGGVVEREPPDAAHGGGSRP